MKPHPIVSGGDLQNLAAQLRLAHAWRKGGKPGLRAALRQQQSRPDPKPHVDSTVRVPAPEKSLGDVGKP
jgi:hypothetical protein